MKLVDNYMKRVPISKGQLYIGSVDSVLDMSDFADKDEPEHGSGTWVTNDTGGGYYKPPSSSSLLPHERPVGFYVTPRVAPPPKRKRTKRIPHFDLIWNLASELFLFSGEEERFADRVIMGNIKDFSIPENVRKFVLQLREVSATLERGGKVFMHCMGGHGRTGMALASVKAIVDNIDPISAIYFAKSMCGGPETKEQVYFVYSLLNSINGKKKK